MDADGATLPLDYPGADEVLFSPVLSDAENLAVASAFRDYINQGLRLQHWESAGQKAYHPDMVYLTFDHQCWKGKEQVMHNLGVQFQAMKGGKYDEIVCVERTGNRVLMRAGNQWTSASGKVFTAYIFTEMYWTFIRSSLSPRRPIAVIKCIIDTGDRVTFYAVVGGYLADDALHGGKALRHLVKAESCSVLEALRKHMPSLFNN